MGRMRALKVLQRKRKIDWAHDSRESERGREIVCVWEWEREKEREKERDRYIYIYREREREGERRQRSSCVKSSQLKFFC